ncbi:MAG TPA: Fe-Mn family superoxide dismutase [Patescibacteria group bacterium]|jgi:Fe-Mn family superoxide dismutase|nr:Fe-Mn family superoxide dismutase [Patescibacteria group bacterium]
MYEAKQFESINGVEGMSERLMKEHYKLYEGYIKKANEITEKLKTVDLTTANATQSDLRALKLGYSFAVNAIKSHELYFDNLSGKGTAPQGWLGSEIEKSFGSYDNWMADMKATGIAARGWVWFAYDWQNGSIFNYLGDAHDAFPIWHATPLVALDVYEHAYMIDYGVARADYIDVFFKNLNWNDVEAKVEKLGMGKQVEQN